MKPVFEVLHPGLSSSFQDNGRRGMLSYGISKSGAMDGYASFRANLQCNNKVSCTVLEFYLMGVRLKVLEESKIALSGVKSSLKVNGKVTPNCITLEKGDEVQIKIEEGAYAYMAIEGGFYAESVLGSTSYHSIANLGGGILQKGQVLYREDIENKIISDKKSHLKIPNYNRKIIRIRKGPEWILFKDKEIENFLEQEFTVKASSNRMSLVLETNKPLVHGHKITSSMVLPGTVQLPPGGKPILLGNDCQTIGGYPRVFIVKNEDQPLAFQKRPLSIIKFSLDF